jgi:hypothetical protein
MIARAPRRRRAARWLDEEVRELEEALQAHPTLDSFLERGLRGLRRLAEALGEVELRRAAAAPSDIMVILRAAGSPVAVESVRGDDPLFRARLRGIEGRNRLLDAEGGSSGVGEVAALLGISRQAVDKRRRQGRLLGLPVGRRGYAYPSWQFTRGGTAPGLERVLHALRELDPWMQASFFLSPNVRTGSKTPLARMREGGVEAVIQAALEFFEHGAS